MSDDLKQRLVRTEVLSPPGEPFTLEAVKPWLKANMAIRKAAADRIEELEAKLAKKDGCLEETYRRWKNGADLRTLAKAEGCTQERMRHKMKRYEEDKVRLLEAKLINAMYEVATYSNDPHLVKWARESLAELKGETGATE